MVLCAGVAPPQSEQLIGLTIFSQSLRVSKDNRTIYYALEMNEADIWLMTLP